MNKTIMSNVRDPASRAEKACVCGGHNLKNFKSQTKNHRTALRKQERRFAEALKQYAEARGVDGHSSDYDVENGGYECAVLKHYATTKEDRQDLCDCGLRAYREITK